MAICTPGVSHTSQNRNSTLWGHATSFPSRVGVCTCGRHAPRVMGGAQSSETTGREGEMVTSSQHGTVCSPDSELYGDEAVFIPDGERRGLVGL